MDKQTKKEIAVETAEELLETARQTAVDLIEDAQGKLLAEMKKEIRQAIKETVNGKIDSLTVKVDAHMNEMRPFLQGWRGARVIGTLIKWIAGIIIAVAGATAVLMQTK